MKRMMVWERGLRCEPIVGVRKWMELDGGKPRHASQCWLPAGFPPLRKVIRGTFVSNLPAPIRNRDSHRRLWLTNGVVVKGGLRIEEAGLCCGMQRWGRNQLGLLRQSHLQLGAIYDGDVVCLTVAAYYYPASEHIDKNLLQ